LVKLISQLNRVRDETKKPNLKDLRESGSIEQDLVKSMMLWNLDKEKKRIGLTVNKNRRGKYGDIEFSFDGEHMTFKEVEFYKERKKQTQKIDWENLQ
jgi:replicative DNA helicase